MRTLSLLIFLAACSSSGSDPETSTPTTIVSMSCTTAVADYCASHACNQTLAGALQDSKLCPASQVQCGEFTVVLKTGTAFFYSDGQLVAIGQSAPPNNMTCLGGPGTFAAPLCASTGKALPPCSSGEPSGW